MMKLLVILFASLILGDSCGQTTAATEKLERPMETPAKESKIVMEKEVLANLLEPTNKSIADFVRDPATKMDAYGPSVGKGSIYRISKFAPTRRIIHYVGVIQDAEALVLSGDPDEFAKFIERSNVSLLRPEDRLGLGKEFLTIAVAGAQRLQIIESVDSIKPRPGLDDARSAQFQAFVAKYTSIVKPPSCSGENCSYFAIAGQDLALFELKISTSGEITSEKKVLEKDLLIPYAM